MDYQTLPEKTEERQRCALTGDEALPSALLCFVLDPAGNVVFDIKHDLPVKARLWLRASRKTVRQAMEQGLFRELDAHARWPEDLPARVEKQLLRRLQETLNLLRRSGALIGGFEKVKATLAQGDVAALVQASDASEDGRAKLAKLAGYHHIPVIDALPREVLAAVTGNVNQSHMAVLEGGLAARFIEESRRFAEYIADESTGKEAP